MEERARAELLNSGHGGDLVAVAPLIERMVRAPDRWVAMAGVALVLALSRAYFWPLGLQNLAPAAAMLADAYSHGPETAHLRFLLTAIWTDLEMVPAAALGYAEWLSEEGEVAAGLAVAYQARALRTVDRFKRAVFVGRMERRLAAWPKAETAFRLAEEVAAGLSLCEVLRAQLGLATVAWGRGNLPAAESEAARIAGAADEGGWQELAAHAYADLAAIQQAMGRLPEAVRAGHRAFLLYGEPARRFRVLGDLGISLAMMGHLEAARDAFRLVIAGAGDWQTRTNAQLELLPIEVALQHDLSARTLARELRHQQMRMPPSMAVDYRVKRAALTGDAEKRTRLLVEALAIAETHKLGKWIHEVGLLLEGTADEPRAGMRPPTGEVAIVARDLRERSLSSV